MPNGIRLHVKMQLEVTTMMRFVSGIRSGAPPFAVQPYVHRPRQLKVDAAAAQRPHRYLAEWSPEEVTTWLGLAQTLAVPGLVTV